MAAEMRASLSLTLNDRASPGLDGLGKAFEKLRETGKQLGLGKLEDSGRTFDGLSAKARELQRDLHGVDQAADRTAGRLSRIGETMRGWGRGAVNLGKNVASPQGAGGLITGALEGAAMVHSIKEYGNYDAIVRRAVVASGISGPAVEPETQRLSKLFKEDALSKGQSSESVGLAYLDLLKQGTTPETAERNLPTHTKAATAYSISPEELGPVSGSFLNTLKLSDEQFPGALVAASQLGKVSRFSMADSARYLPGITGNMATFGMTGRKSLDYALASLGTIVESSTDAASAATNYNDMLNYFASPMAARSLALDSRGMAPNEKALLNKYHLHGIDRNAVLEKARAVGMDPSRALIGAIQHQVKGLPQDVQKLALGAYIHNQQARDAVQGMLLHPEKTAELEKMFNASDPTSLDRDFTTMRGTAKVETTVAGEGLEQIERRFGEGFSILLKPFNAAMDGVLKGFDAVDEKAKGVVDATLAAAGALVTLTAGLGTLGFLIPGLTAGGVIGAAATFVGAPLLGAAAVAGTAYAVHQWGYLQSPEFVSPGNPLNDLAPRPEPNPWHPTMTDQPQPLSIFGGGLPPVGWGPQPSAEPDQPSPSNLFRGGTPPGGWGPQPPTEIVIRAAPGTEVVEVNGGNKNVKVDPGSTVGRP